MIDRDLKERPHYLSEALRFRDTDLIKVITGVEMVLRKGAIAEAVDIIDVMRPTYNFKAS